MTILAICCFLVAASALAWGIVTEHRQTRESGPVSIVPTLPFAWGASVLVTVGVVSLPVPLPWWGYAAILLSTLILFSTVTIKAGSRRE